MTSLSKPWRIIGVLALAQLLFVITYIMSERSLAFWDYAMYARMAIGWFGTQGFSAAFDTFIQSLSQKYNLIYALPSFVSFALFGATRNVFIVTNFVVFFLLHEAAIAFVLRRVFAIGWPRALLWSLGLCWLVPFMWYPLLEGYPDNGAAAALVFALGFALPKHKSWKQALAIGALFGLSVVLRRHYAYPVLSALFVFGLFDAFPLLRGKGSGRKNKILALGKTYGMIAVGLIGTMVALEPLYVLEMIKTSYASLYISYERPPAYVALFALSRLGLFLIVPTVAGFWAGLKNGKQERERIAKIAALAPAWFLIWCFGPGQAGEHYLISILPVVCVVGLYAGFHELPKKPAKGYLPHVAGALLLINALHAFWFSPFVVPTDTPRLGVFSLQRPPWVREDYDEVIALADYLGKTTSPQDKIVVAGSSFAFNQDLMRAAYTDALPDVSPAFRFLQAPESDGEQEPPLNVYAIANIYVVATPAQYHLEPERQKVITALTDMFPPDEKAASVFSKDQRTFKLMNGVNVEIWRRKADWSPALLHHELQRMRALADTTRKWITTQTTGQSDYINHPSQGEVYVVRHGKRLGFTSLYLDQPVPNGQYRIKLLMNGDAGCENLSFSVRAETENGKSVATRPSSPFHTIGPYYIPFVIEGKRDANSFVTLTMTTTTNDVCTVALWQLQLEQMNP